MDPVADRFVICPGCQGPTFPPLPPDASLVPPNTRICYICDRSWLFVPKEVLDAEAKVWIAGIDCPDCRAPARVFSIAPHTGEKSYECSAGHAGPSRRARVTMRPMLRLRNPRRPGSYLARSAP